MVGRVRYCEPRPKRVVIQRDAENPTARYQLFATVGTEPPGPWKDLPHYKFANLPTKGSSRQILPMLLGGGTVLPPLDAGAAKKFFEDYGVVTSKAESEISQGLFGLRPLELVFAVGSYELSLTQDLLRQAWIGDRTAVEQIKKQAVLEFSAEVGGMELVAKNLWSLICFLFMDDRAAGKIAVCKNPGCSVTPYFLKIRETQRFCSDVCADYGRSQNALRYWNTKGWKKREERLHVGKNAGLHKSTKSKDEKRTERRGARTKGNGQGDVSDDL
jgi:hypothetical protein